MADIVHSGFAAAPSRVREPSPADSNPRTYERRRRRLERSISVIIPLALFLLWEIAGRNRWIDIRYFPPPSTILMRWWTIIGTGEYAGHLKASLARIVQGYFLGAGIGLVLGTIIGSIPLLKRGFEPILIGFNTIPKLAVLPLLLLLFGIGEVTKVFIVALSVIFVVLLSTMYAVSTVSNAYRETAGSFGANRLNVLLHVDLPAALPHIFTGLRLAASISIVVIVGAEFVAAKEGLGFMVWNSWNLGIPVDMYIGIVSMALLGVTTVSLLQIAYRFLAPWDR